jgi:hypothetical protein
LNEWPFVQGSSDAPWATTVTHWWDNYPDSKREGFLPFMSIPSKVCACFEIRSAGFTEPSALCSPWCLERIPKECLPQDWAEFADYFSEMVQSEILNVSDRSRTMARRLLAGADSWVPVPVSYQDLTVALLPSPVRRRFGFSFNDEQKRQFDHALL